MSDATLKQNLSPTAAHVLDHLRWADGPLTIKQLETRTGRHHQTVREACQELLDRGVVKDGYRNDDPQVRTFAIE